MQCLSVVIAAPESVNFCIPYVCRTMPFWQSVTAYIGRTLPVMRSNVQVSTLQAHHEFFWGIPTDQAVGAVLPRWKVHSQLLTVPTRDSWHENTSNCQPLHLPWPCAISAVVTWLSLPYVWHVQARHRTGPRSSLLASSRYHGQPQNFCTTLPEYTTILPEYNTILPWCLSYCDVYITASQVEGV